MTTPYLSKTATGKDALTSGGKWFIVDAEGQVLGRLASRLAVMLMGKHRPNYTRHISMGDFVVVINAEKVKVTGRKSESKIYKHFTGYPSGLKEAVYKDVIRKSPTRPLREAVRGMLPKSALGHKMLNHLKIYSGAAHPHAAQQPTEMKLS